MYWHIFIKFVAVFQILQVLAEIQLLIVFLEQTFILSFIFIYFPVGKSWIFIRYVSCEVLSWT